MSEDELTGDETPPYLDHPYEAPPDEPWGRCVVCHLAEAAHKTSLTPYKVTALPARQEVPHDIHESGRSNGGSPGRRTAD